MTVFARITTWRQILIWHKQGSSSCYLMEMSCVDAHSGSYTSGVCEFLCKYIAQIAPKSHFVRCVTHTPSRIVLNEWSARRTNFYLQNKYKKPTFKPSAGYEPAIPAIVHLQTTPRQHGHRDRSLARMNQRLWRAEIRYVHLYVFVGYSSPRVTFQICVCLLSIRPARLYFSLYSSTCCQSS